MIIRTKNSSSGWITQKKKKESVITIENDLKGNLRIEI